jgi:hypothetical protein
MLSLNPGNLKAGQPRPAALMLHFLFRKSLHYEKKACENYGPEQIAARRN